MPQSRLSAIEEHFEACGYGIEQEMGREIIVLDEAGDMVDVDVIRFCHPDLYTLAGEYASLREQADNEKIYGKSEMLFHFQDKAGGMEIAVVQCSKATQDRFHQKEFEVVYNADTGTKLDLNDEESYVSFGGSVGFRTAEFNTLWECMDYIKTGLRYQDTHVDIWTEMLIL